MLKISIAGFHLLVEIVDSAELAGYETDVQTRRATD